MWFAGIILRMDRLNSYVAIIALVFFGGHIVNYTPETQEVPEIVLLNSNTDVRDSFAQTPEPTEEPKPETKTYKKNERLSPQELKDILYQVGFRGEALRIAWGTAMKESSGRPMAHNKNSNTGDNSYGLFQINMIGDLGPARLKKFKLESNEDLFDPVRNAEIAFFMSNKGKNWSAWHGITSKTRQYMKQFPG
jgi:hypothetical protein